MLSTAIGAFIGVILGGTVYERFIKEEEEIKVEHRHEYHITNNEKDVSLDKIVNQIKEKVGQVNK